MKTKYPNFNNPGASAPEPTFVPTHLIRKHWSIQMVEMYQLVLCIILFFFVFSAHSEMGIIAAVSVLSLLFSVLIASVFSIMDNYRYRVIAQVSHMIISIAFGVVAFLDSDIFELAIAIVSASSMSVFIVTFPENNRAYYAWCKSIAK